ncbi:MAG: hypothetical protein Q9195_005651 [Heterodermia aff. obscurata]
MPYPSHDEVRDIVSTMFGGGGDADPAGFDKVIDDGFQGAVVGREFALSADSVVGKQAWIDQLVHPLRDAKDLDKPSAMTVVADDGWNAIELLGTGTSKAGKEWHNETVVLARFTEDKKLIEAKVFLDQAHIQKHLDDADVAGPAKTDTK